MASRRRRRKSIGKVIVDVERRVRRVEKRPGAKRLKANVVTTEKLGYRAVTTKVIQIDAVDTENIAPDAVTPDEASFGTTIVSDTEPTEYLKEGTTWVNPDDGATNVYSTDLEDFVTVTDANAMATADGKNTIYVQTSAPTGGTYKVNDLWYDSDDGNKLYAWSGTAWVSAQDTAIAAAAAAATAAQSTADGKNKIYRQTTEPTGETYAAGDTWFDTDGDNAIYRYSLSTNSTVSNKALTSNVATLTASAAHSFTPGESIVVTSVDATFNGTYTVISVPTTTTLTYTKTNANVTSAAASGTITNSAGWKAIVLGNSALVSISANKITAGTIDASVITVSNINASNISTGTINADRIQANSLSVDKLTAGTFRAGTIYTGDIAASQITAGTITAAISMTSPTLTSGVISTNAVTSFSSVSTGAPRVTLAPSVLSWESSGVGIAMDSGAGSAPGGLSIAANLSGTSSNLSIYGQSFGSGTGRGTIVLNSAGTGTSGYAAIGVAGGDNNNNILITNTYAELSTGSLYSRYALRNIKCVTSFTPGSDTTGTDGDVVLVYTA